MKEVLLFHVFPINNWKSVSQNLLSNVPHDDVYIHVSFHQHLTVTASEINSFFYSIKKVKHIYYSQNSNHPEVDAFNTFKSNIDLTQYSLLTYMHAKGVTKPESQNIADWTELMRYFIMDRMSNCRKAFANGYLLYGVNKTREPKNKEGYFKEVDYFYAGNFVSVKLTPDVTMNIKSLPIIMNYYGLEGFWGKLSPGKLAFNAFHSRINHYTSPFPASFYKTKSARLKYSITAVLYEKYFSVLHQIKDLMKNRSTL